MGWVLCRWGRGSGLGAVSVGEGEWVGCCIGSQHATPPPH